MRQMPGASIKLGIAQTQIDTVDDWQAYGYTAVTVNRQPPSSQDIDLMDIVWPWLSLISPDKLDERLVVAHRMLWDPDKGRSHWSYRRLADKLHTSAQIIKHRDESGILIIAAKVSHLPAELAKVDRFLREADGDYGGFEEVRRREERPRGAGVEFYSRVAA